MSKRGRKEVEEVEEEAAAEAPSFVTPSGAVEDHPGVVTDLKILAGMGAPVVMAAEGLAKALLAAGLNELRVPKPDDLEVSSARPRGAKAIPLFQALPADARGVLGAYVTAQRHVAAVNKKRAAASAKWRDKMKAAEERLIAAVVRYSMRNGAAEGDVHTRKVNFAGKPHVITVQKKRVPVDLTQAFILSILGNITRAWLGKHHPDVVDEPFTTDHVKLLSERDVRTIAAATRKAIATARARGALTTEKWEIKMEEIKPSKK